MKQHETIAHATDQPIPPTTNTSAELEQAGPTNAEIDLNKKDGHEQPSKWAVFAILAVGIFMASLDSSIVNISLPTIAHFYGVPLSGAVEWVIIAYLVVTAGVLLTVGRVADSIGRKPIWVAGLVLFTAGSALSAASVSLDMLIAARALQGLGGAFVLAISPAMLISAFPARERGRAGPECGHRGIRSERWPNAWRHHHPKFLVELDFLRQRPAWHPWDHRLAARAAGKRAPGARAL